MITTQLAVDDLGVVPGVYDITAEEYHADPVPGGSLSSTGARRLITPSCPALFRHWADNPQLPKKHFDIGTAVHTVALGNGPELVTIDHDDYKTAEAQAEKADAYAVGQVPLLPHERRLVDDMAEVLFRHPLAAELLAPGWGEPEQTLIWCDEETGVWCRSRPDVHNEDEIVDLKTTTNANPDVIAKTVYEYGYHQQQQWYRSGHYAVYGDYPRFRFIFQAKTPPYLVTVVELDDAAALAGEARNRQARHTYAHCMSTGEWPGYGDHTHQISLPPWAEKREENEGYL